MTFQLKRFLRFSGGPLFRASWIRWLASAAGLRWAQATVRGQLPSAADLRWASVGRSAVLSQIFIDTPTSWLTGFAFAVSGKSGMASILSPESPSVAG